MSQRQIILRIGEGGLFDEVESDAIRKLLQPLIDKYPCVCTIAGLDLFEEEPVLRQKGVVISSSRRISLGKMELSSGNDTVQIPVGDLKALEFVLGFWTRADEWCLDVPLPLGDRARICKDGDVDFLSLEGPPYLTSELVGEAVKHPLLKEWS